MKLHNIDQLKNGAVFLINKKVNWTSFDVVKKMRSCISQKYSEKIKVGHAGTLDPLAEGLLIVCTGKKTKEISEFQNLKLEQQHLLLILKLQLTEDLTFHMLMKMVF